MTALTGEDLLAWLERTTLGWCELLAEHPSLLTLPCDVREAATVADLLQHIAAVELRYAQRLQGFAESPYEAVPMHSATDLATTHARTMSLLLPLLTIPQTPWDESVEFTTRSGGALQATRRTILVHLAMHSIRHYAQLATLVRRHGIKPSWPMDYLFMAATPA